MNQRIPTFGSLYAGVGGIDKGFEQAGFHSKWANEWNEKANSTFIKNFAHFLFSEDVQYMFPEEHNDIKDVDIIVGGPPCQSFSLAGSRKGFDDPRGMHFFEMLRIAKDVNAETIFFENVKNFYHHDKGRTYQIATQALTDAGYAFKDSVLNTMTHGGLPQNRERFYLVASSNHRLVNEFEFPDEIPLDLSIKDCLEKHVPEKYFYERYSMHDRLQREMTNPNTIYQWRRKYVRENKRGVCPTLTKNMGTGGHNVPLIFDGERIRKLTPRECFNFQGFWNIEFPDHPAQSDSHLYQQAGNSVSVPVIRRIAEKLMEAIDATKTYRSIYVPTSR